MRIRPLRHRPPAGDSGSILLALLVSLVGMSLSALALPVVLGQATATKENAHRITSLAAAQAGLDVALGHIRAANDGTIVNGALNGTLADLPCGNLTGAVEGSTPGRYLVLVDYFVADPQAKSDSWIAANRLNCIGGGGTPTTPTFALLRSYGTDLTTGAITSVSNRLLRGTYTFRTTNQNISGGKIHVYKTNTSTDLCMDAGSGSPAGGSSLRMRPCVTGSLQQVFSYNNNLTISLVNSQTPTLPLGMCLDAATPHATNATVVFQPCGTTTLPRQQWSTNDSANLEGTTNGSTLDGYCFNVQTPNTSGSLVILTNSNCHGGYNNVQTWSPEASVGAGAATNTANEQLVNFSQFGRCLDVTEQNVNYAYVIAWPCKQAPDPDNVTWNQKWTQPVLVGLATSATGRITTTPPAGPYCLQSPRSIAVGQYVRVVLCSLVTGAAIGAITWTVYGDTGIYETSYRIKDGTVSGAYCLQATDPSLPTPDFYPNGLAISKLIVATCSGSTLQKWNADPNILKALPLKDIGEN